MGLPDLTAWRTESLRLTVFFAMPIAANGLGWWKRVSGADPETTTNRPAAGEYSEAGALLDGQFEMKVAFNRADWILSYPFSGMPGAPEPGTLSDLSGAFVSMLQNLMQSLEFPVVRVAVGLVAIDAVAGEEQGNAVIESILPFVKFDPVAESKDIMIQVNNPARSRVVDVLELNRISKVGLMTRQLVTVGPNGIPSMVSDKVVRAEFDMSTSVESTLPLSPEQLVALAAELRDTAISFLEFGVRKDG